MELFLCLPYCGNSTAACSNGIADQVCFNRISFVCQSQAQNKGWYFEQDWIGLHSLWFQYNAFFIFKTKRKLKQTART